MLTAVLVDDEVHSSELLREMLEETGLWSVQAVFDRCSTFLDWMTKEGHQAQVAFLDIGMPVMSGIELASRLRRISPAMEIVFITGSRDFALAAYDVQAVGYLVKPALAQDILKLTQRLIRLLPKVAENDDGRVAPVLQPRQLPSTQSAGHPRGDATEGKTNSVEVSLRYFGSFLCVCASNDCPDGVRTVKWRTRKAKELFVYLSLRNGKPVTIDHLLDLLWGEVEERQARTQFHTTLYQMKQSLDAASMPYRLVTTAGQYVLMLEGMSSDLQQFLSASRMAVSLSSASRNSFNQASCQQNKDVVPWFDPNDTLWEQLLSAATIPKTDGRESSSEMQEDPKPPLFDNESIQAFEEVLRQYRGTFLEAERYEWASAFQMLLQQQVAHMSMNLATHHFNAGKEQEAIQTLLTATVKVPWDEEVHAMLLRHYCQSRNRAAFLVHYRQMEHVLRKELGIQPSRECRTMLERIRTMEDTHAAPERS